MYLPTSHHKQDVTRGQVLGGGFEFRIFLLLDWYLTKAKEFNLPYYLPIAGERIIGFIPFPRVLALCEMQSASSRIWTRAAVSISHDNNHSTTSHLQRSTSVVEVVVHFQMVPVFWVIGPRLKARISNTDFYGRQNYRSITMLNLHLALYHTKLS